MRGGAGVGDLLREKGGQARGRFAALAGWEDVGQARLTIPKLNAALYAFDMKNRFRVQRDGRVL